jgi:hypothetical protein
MCTTPVLATPDFTKKIVRPLAFENNQLKGKNLLRPIYEKKMLAILHVVKKWRPYLIGRHIKVKTYHDSLNFEVLLGAMIIFRRATKMGYKDARL